MINVDTDIDIDFADRDHALDGLRYVSAMQQNGMGQKVRHNVGVYFQDAPVDPLTGLCSFDYEEAGNLGYFKIDFLPNSIYASVRDEEHLDALMAREPEWSLLEFPEIVERLAHVNGHIDIVRRIKPTSVEDLAVVIALPRPGKAHLIDRPRAEIDAHIWEPTESYYYKRSHAIAYAVSIAVQLNLITDEWSAKLDADKAETADAV
jgi:hypothetical protein